MKEDVWLERLEDVQETDDVLMDQAAHDGR
jgi:hypothetical protein